MRPLPVILGIVALVVAGAIFWAFYSLDYIVKLALEMYGPDVLGAPVKVSQVHISTQTGEGLLKDLEIGSPKGFSSPHALKVASVKVSITPASLTEKVVYVREVAVEAPLITYERGRDGGNLETIQKNIEAYLRRSAGEGVPKSAAGSEDRKRFIVERIAIRGARVTMTNPALKGQGITFDLPEIQMTDVGKRQNGLRVSEIANLVTRELLAKIAQRVLTNLELLKKGGTAGARDALKGIFK